MIYTLTNIVTFLFLTFNSPTTFIFDSPIEYISMSNEADFSTYKSKDGKKLSIKSFKNDFESNLTVITKNGTFPFNLKTSSAKSPMIYTIVEGDKSSQYFVTKETDEYELLEGEKIYLLKIKNNKIKTVNDVPARTQQYLPKNAKIKIDENYIN